MDLSALRNQAGTGVLYGSHGASVRILSSRSESVGAVLAVEGLTTALAQEAASLAASAASQCEGHLMTVRQLVGDCRTTLPTLEPGSVQAIVTSPPYWRQRDYQVPGQIGQETTPEQWVSEIAQTLSLAREILRPDGCLWLNVGDKYAAGGLGGGGMAEHRKNWRGTVGKKDWRSPPEGYKPKDLTLAPFKLAEALRQDGWYLRATIVWEKAAAVEPPRLDRPSVSHEYVFLFSVNEDSTVRHPGEPWWYTTTWRIPQQSDAEHPAVMPFELARRCIVASTRPGDWVLDPFSGYGTTLLAADRNERHAIGIELNPDYAALARRRLESDAPMFTEVEVA